MLDQPKKSPYRRYDLRPSFEAMQALLNPRSVAILGASAREGSLGQRLLTSATGWRFKGDVYPINPGYKEINGVTCYPSLKDVGKPIDLVAFAVSDDRVATAFADAIADGAKAGVIFGRLYEAEPGEPSRPDQLAMLARDNGIALCGGNCMGFINMHAGLRMSGNPPPAETSGGAISIVSHSGSTWSGLVGSQRDLDLGYCISAGQELGTTMADYIDFILKDGKTRAIGLVIEAVRDPENFLAAADRAFAQGVPLVALKLGRSELGRKFALSHSGALSGTHSVYEAMFAKHNIASCRTLDEFTDTLELMACKRKPSPGGLGATTDSGAERQLVVDLAEDIGCPIAVFSSETERKLVEVLDPGMAPQNPVDVYGDGKFVLRECLDIVAEDESVGMVAMVTNLVDGRPRLMNMVNDAVEQSSAKTQKPFVVLSNVHSTVSRSAAKKFRFEGIPVLMGTATGLHAIKSFFNWHRKRGQKAPQVDEVSPSLVAHWRKKLQTERLDPQDGLKLFEAFGGVIAPSTIVTSADDAVAAAKKFGFPIVLKTANPDIAHKTEAGGVALSIQTEQAVRAAFEKIAAACGPSIQVQKQSPEGIEIFLGMVRDPDFGPVMTFGIGGIFVEVLRDTITVIPPVTKDEVLALLQRLRGYGILNGARGKPKADVDALARNIAAFSSLAHALGDELSEFDVNPIMVGAWGAMAVDALVVHGNK